MYKFHISLLSIFLAASINGQTAAQSNKTANISSNCRVKVGTKLSVQSNFYAHITHVKVRKDSKGALLQEIKVTPYRMIKGKKFKSAYLYFNMKPNLKPVRGEFIHGIVFDQNTAGISFKGPLDSIPDGGFKNVNLYGGKLPEREDSRATSQRSNIRGDFNNYIWGWDNVGPPCYQVPPYIGLPPVVEPLPEPVPVPSDPASPGQEPPNQGPPDNGIPPWGGDPDQLNETHKDFCRDAGKDGTAEFDHCMDRQTYNCDYFPESPECQEIEDNRRASDDTEPVDPADLNPL